MALTKPSQELWDKLDDKQKAFLRKEVIDLIKDTEDKADAKGYAADIIVDFQELWPWMLPENDDERWELMRGLVSELIDDQNV
jgi:hypothetical protein